MTWVFMLIAEKGSATMFTRIRAAALIKFFTPLIKGGVYSKKVKRDKELS